MDDPAIATLPEQYRGAASYLEGTFRTRPLTVKNRDGQMALHDATVQTSRGFDLQLWKPDASTDLLRIAVTSPQLINSDVADAVSKMVPRALHEIAAVRNEVILLSPSEYTEDVKKRLRALLGEAKKAGIPGSEFDFTGSSVLSTNFSGNQIPNYGIQLIEGANSTSIRINIPTNPTQLEQAMETAKRVEANLNQRLPEIKENMIKHIVRKNYIPNLTEEGQKHLREHEFKVSVQQQANWTSIFIDVVSPEQKQAREHPDKKFMEPADLQKTNMFSKITDEQKRFKMASRAILYEGEKLRTPSAIFNDVAGVLDLDNGIGKILHYLGKARPELKSEIDALLKENVFKRREQWNLPPDQQEDEKRRIQGQIDPDHPTVMNFTFPVPKGKADEIMQAIAALGVAKQEPAVVPQQPAAVAINNPETCMCTALPPEAQEKAMATAVNEVLAKLQPAGAAR